MALAGVLSAWLSVHALLCACSGQDRRAVPAGFPTLDDLQGPDRFPSAATAPARTLPAGFPAVDDNRESAWSPSAARTPARTLPEEFPTLDDLVGPDEVTTVKTPRSFVHFKGPQDYGPLDYHPDLTELILIAGHTDAGGGLQKMVLSLLTESGGWERGLWMRHMEDPEHCYFDRALTWRRGTECYATWSATDDMKDFLMQSFPNMAIDDEGNPNTTRMCGFDINAFIAFQMEGFMRSPEWPDFVNFFADERCQTVTSVGHSLGGAMATLFAACANARAEGFGGRHDFGLVTYGNFPISTEPLYSGTPGTPFRGTRYHIANPGYKPLLRDPKAFRLDLLELHRRIAKMTVGQDGEELHTKSSVFDEHAKAVAELPDSEVEPYWAEKKIDRLLRPFHRAVHMLGTIDSVTTGMGFNVTVFRAVQAYFHELGRKLVASGNLFFDYDPISQVNKVYGYKHALVDFQPVSNKNTVVAVGMERVPAELATELPDVDPWQASFGLTTTGRLPNHYICCYYRGSRCIYLFRFASYLTKACAAAVFR